jgi:hypothetical protein
VNPYECKQYMKLFYFPATMEDLEKLTLRQNLCMLPVWESLRLLSVLERHKPSHSHVM